MKVLFSLVLLVVFGIGVCAQEYNSPESVAFDAVNGQYLVSNTNGNQVLALNAPDAVPVVWLDNVDSPTGLHILAGVLYVNAGSHVLGYDLESGDLVMDVVIDGEFLVNDVTSNGLDKLYVSGTFGKTIYEVDVVEQTYATIIEGTGLNPNGVFYDLAQNRLLVVYIGAESPIQAVYLGVQPYSLVTLYQTTATILDGITKDEDGFFYVSDFGNGEILKFDEAFSLVDTYVTQYEQPADIYYDGVGERLCIPYSGADAVEFLPLNSIFEVEVPQFIVPMQLKEGTTGYNDFYTVSNYMDHDPSDAFMDGNCNVFAYDGHLGTDYYPWPFPWYMMENDLVEIIAAADGEIIAKHDGEFDMNCELDWSNTANSVTILHKDGYVTSYSHFKNGSLTDKSVGDLVTQGEYLGTVGSSGYSDNPHLHFELTDAQGNAIDPFLADCNPTTVSDWWVGEQEIYREPKIHQIATHDVEPTWEWCVDDQLPPNYQNTFTIGDTIYLSMFLSNESTLPEAVATLTYPDGTVNDFFNFVSEDDYEISFWWWIQILSDAGDYTYQVISGEDTLLHTFTVETPPTALSEITRPTISIYPNPASDHFSINAKGETFESIELRNLNGSAAYPVNAVGDNQFSLATIPAGLYLVEILFEDGVVYEPLVVR